jgi:anti-anti-sigma factor
MLKINMEYRKGILFVRLKGELTKYTCKSLENYLIPLISRHGIKYLIYNLGAIKLLDNDGKDTLKKGVAAARKNYGEGAICNAKKTLASEFILYDDELVALSSIQV